MRGNVAVHDVLVQVVSNDGKFSPEHNRSANTAVSTAAIALTCVTLCRNKDRNEEVMRNREQRLAERKTDTEIGSPFLLSWFGKKTTDVEDVSCLP